MGAKTILSHSFRIAWKDLTELFRNRLGLVLLIVMPLFMMAMIGFIYPSGNTTISNMPVAVVNDDSGFYNSTLPSQAFLMGLQQINTQTHMLVLSNASNIDAIKDKVQKGDLDGGIIIPSNFSECVMNGQQGTIIIVTDESNPTISATMKAALSATVDQIGLMLAQQNWQVLTTTVTTDNALALVKPYAVSTEGVVSGNPSYFDFIAPASWYDRHDERHDRVTCGDFAGERNRHHGRHDGCPH
jgi:ABC-type Na+ efflux pump permease subunit